MLDQAENFCLIQLILADGVSQSFITKVTQEKTN